MSSKTKPVRKPRSVEELQQASEHLEYEVWMLQVLANALASTIFGQSPINNAVLESFAVHARSLLDFAYNQSPREDDVVASDFLQPGVKWDPPNPSRTLQQVNRRVNKEIVHLTFGRLLVTQEMKGWPFLAIAAELAAIIRSFLNFVPNEHLGSRCQEFKATRLP